MKYNAIRALCAVLTASEVGCSKTDSPIHDYDTAAIQLAATTLTLQSPHPIPNTGSWPRGLIQPEPIRFYRDRVNLVIVLTDQPDMTEAGLYVHVSHSSYRPIGDSEWRFRPLSDGVYQYERKR